MALESTQPLVKMNTRNISWGKGSQCVGLTTSPPSCAECHEIWKPKPFGTLWATSGLLQDPCIFWTNCHKGEMEVLRDRHCIADEGTRISFILGKENLLIVNVNFPSVRAIPKSPSFLLQVRWPFLRRHFIGIYV
jgi:hypothetical protein